MQKLLRAAAFLVVFHSLAQAVPVTEIGAFTFPMTVGGSTLQIPYDANLSLSASHPQVDRAVILLHGTSRLCRNAYDTLLEAADLAGANLGSTLLVAPQFLLEEDIAAFQLPADRLFWSDSGWKEGNPSLSTTAHPRPAQLSSFAVMDSILVRIASLNPNLQSVVFAGHSAGAQFVQRFAAGSTARDRLQNPYGVEIKYVVANPSSYLYLDPQRVVPGTVSQFAVPPSATIQSCSNYDRYKYGLQSRNAYMSQLSSSQIVVRYRDGRVSVLLGELDNDPAGVDLDTSCAAELQGSNRRERGLIYDNYLKHLFGASIVALHPTLVVAGVGHSSHDMYTSACGIDQLFGVGGCDPVTASIDAGASSIVRAEIRPSPFRSRTTLDYRVPEGHGRTLLRVYDVAGRLVRTIPDLPSTDGRGSIVWDARSNAGLRVPPGVYFFQLQNGPMRLTRRVVVLD